MFYSFISFIFACLLVGVFYSLCCRFSLFTLLLSHVVTPHVFKSSFHYIIISVFSQIIQKSLSAQLSAQDVFSNKRLFMVAVLF